MATKKAVFAGPMKKVTSNIKSAKAKPAPVKPMKDCGCGGNGKR